MSKILLTILLASFLVASPAYAQHSEVADGDEGVHLSPDLLELLRSEMREVAKGMQVIPLALASAQWHEIHETAGQIKDSYILKQSLTKDQLEELRHALPEPFKTLDGEFHQRAGKLAEAAKRKDAEGVAFQYSRMLENCTSCHSKYAQERFPGFVTQQQKHQH